MNIVKVSHLVKEYKKIKKDKGLKGAVKNLFVQDVEYVRAVDDISVEIEKGDIVAYIGPNGAGKSTLLYLISGLLKPSEGTVNVNGFNPWDR
ncbi:MAG: ATP-binding cassette domain-containing protein, partial [Lachnospiraceae bacterium]|nr:ATP-binding cassette domain-containing protein [Lachnospiraceae bacterium]